MKIAVPQNLSVNVRTLMQRAGYHVFRDPNTLNDSFVMRLGRSFYPRYHVYLHTTERGPLLDIHFDMKRASYQGQRAHSGIYEGADIEEEVARLKRWIAYFH
ncbi:MAG: hypothetical protein A3B74_04530 [Candidatus Kerfeldbacteria bacterium RIFCSPHIGHO2_02_FULL_42_14]|uniref:Uncharacterized protein n=1 Tax=Candidatus Kerfeldbacteria bacterium RIFCSPHIGHO2_02_FULL_42_14 TaxID=1798540 RepID=A0A1G2APY6_9BACT|nr:MAG: hypothetical protein A3B74_04530 [Candidatus Kerfeldbacteria bacterium RIFCSPHIGHO2_02_FULL_42_14]OGY80799.1 MAG: hypothetical protein A3E60_01290 [Candidatus Kerfeldbacteria bacterium RIFCSPHIGHO2_12_FULL_42_13]OGY84970.1 MAG: hypothetical protein A3I91_00625 [Candidatus Kerfeldbacteria bacterium RIFCSPLOWO2_02_FULL_42_19]OGY86138.1 MAG: hypothetical protein A3G01_02160 [Candidatus Kerfeldbacteria bacterium RIFCSPLOWO2_12_FULL_43_9]